MDAQVNSIAGYADRLAVKVGRDKAIIEKVIQPIEKIGPMNGEYFKKEQKAAVRKDMYTRAIKGGLRSMFVSGGINAVSGVLGMSGSAAGGIGAVMMVTATWRQYKAFNEANAKAGKPTGFMAALKDKRMMASMVTTALGCTALGMNLAVPGSGVAVGLASMTVGAATGMVTTYKDAKARGLSGYEALSLSLLGSVATFAGGALGRAGGADFSMVSEAQAAEPSSAADFYRVLVESQENPNTELMQQVDQANRDFLNGENLSKMNDLQDAQGPIEPMKLPEVAVNDPVVTEPTVKDVPVVEGQVVEPVQAEPTVEAPVYVDGVEANAERILNMWYAENPELLEQRVAAIEAYNQENGTNISPERLLLVASDAGLSAPDGKHTLFGPAWQEAHGISGDSVDALANLFNKDGSLNMDAQTVEAFNEMDQLVGAKNQVGNVAGESSYTYSKGDSIYANGAPVTETTAEGNPMVHGGNELGIIEKIGIDDYLQEAANTSFAAEGISDQVDALKDRISARSPELGEKMGVLLDRLSDAADKTADNVQATSNVILEETAETLGEIGEASKQEYLELKEKAQGDLTVEEKAELKADLAHITTQIDGAGTKMDANLEMAENAVKDVRVDIVDGYAGALKEIAGLTGGLEDGSIKSSEEYLAKVEDIDNTNAELLANSVETKGRFDAISLETVTNIREGNGDVQPDATAENVLIPDASAGTVSKTDAEAVVPSDGKGRFGSMAENVEKLVHHEGTMATIGSVSDTNPKPKELDEQKGKSGFSIAKFLRISKDR